MATGRTKKPVDRITTAQLEAAMSKRWSAPEYALLWEVADATGGRQSRMADALIMGLYPSRTIDLEGVEIKTHRSDWLKEMRNPGKAEAISRYCDFWWVHATPDVVKPDELPAGWGLRVYNGRIWSTVHQAERRSPEPIPRTFLAALLRRSDQQMTKQATRLTEELIQKERQNIDLRISEEVNRRTSLSASLAVVAEEFEAATGFDLKQISMHGSARYAARITAALMKQDLHNPYSGLEWLVKQLRQTADATAEAMASIGLEPPTLEQCARRRR